MLKEKDLLRKSSPTTSEPISLNNLTEISVAKTPIMISNILIFRDKGVLVSILQPHESAGKWITHEIWEYNLLTAFGIKAFVDSSAKSAKCEVLGALKRTIANNSALKRIRFDNIGKQ